ncbi:GNAT family N-acetyltransferase [Sediminibacillus massiliensis]|uniref:GNAT family N-acetyltransferase n=1 Tax=Sediminibacillus massiliensis TaxID=1926277 RepID=UPI0009888A12|nr:GNAT family N-acetyltransferase [Sediminibacillus massiliensis]
MHIRQATINDAKDIAQVSVESWQSTYKGIIAQDILKNLSIKNREQKWRERLQTTNQILLVAESEKDGIVGFINGGIERTNQYDYDAEIYSLYLLKEYQRQKLGHRLVKALAAYLIEAGNNSLMVWVLKDNPSRRFYETYRPEFVDEKLLEELGVKEIAYGWKDLKIFLPA